MSRKGRVQPGVKFGRLTVLSRVLSSRNECGQYRWQVRCSCGTTKEVWGYSLAKQKEATKSCGKCGIRKKSDTTVNAEKDAGHAMKKETILIDDEPETETKQLELQKIERLFDCPECPAGVAFKSPEEMGTHLERHSPDVHQPEQKKQHKYDQCTKGCARWFPKGAGKGASKDWKKHIEICDGQEPILKAKPDGNGQKKPKEMIPVLGPRQALVPLPGGQFTVIDLDRPKRKETRMPTPNEFSCEKHPDAILKSSRARGQHYRHHHKGESIPEKTMSTPQESVPRFRRAKHLKGSSDDEISDRKQDVVKSLRALVEALKTRRDGMDGEIQEYDELMRKMEEET